MRVTVFLIGIFWLNIVERVDAGRASTWEKCNCHWATWRSWSECTSTCFGTMERIRAVISTNIDGCDEFSDCASADEGLGWERRGCNEICYNGGSPDPESSDNWIGRLFAACTCKPAYEGSCCKDRVTCGSLDSIANGSVSYPNTYYGTTARYTCRRHYKLTDGSTSRTCGEYSIWSGEKPRCAYVNHCASRPCQNGARCTDLLDDYRCTCQSGWKGRHCEYDIQPPVMSECPGDQKFYTTSHIMNVSWTEPTFVDPFGKAVQVTANYPSPQFTFPWGDFTVQYVATKPSNGLQTKCKFQIGVRPTPCDEINIPNNGARLCNGWRTDYGRFCLVACLSSYTIDASFYSYETFHVCGASGRWIPTGPLPDCDIHMSDARDITAYQPDYKDLSFKSTCHDANTKRRLSEFYISKISADFSFQELCSNHPDECLPEKVQVDCDSGDA